MKFTIIGAGAVGCYYGAMLARGGHDVTVIGRPVQVDAIRRFGLRIDSAAFQGAVPVHAVTDPAEAGAADIVLVCVKSADTESAGRALAPALADRTAVFSFQNGIDNGDRLASVLNRPVVSAAVYVAAEMIEPGHVKHHGHGDIEMGTSPASERFAAALRESGIAATITDDIRAVLWRKLITNCCYNALSAIAQLPYGRLLELPDVRDVMRDVVDECLAVAKASGIALPGDPLPAVLKIAAAMPGQMSSTAQDLARGKPSEIDHLNGAILRAGARFGIPVPANRALYTLVKLAESKARGREHGKSPAVVPAFSNEETAMKSREERIEARASELSEVDGQPGSKDRKYWAQAAKLIDEEDERIAKATVEDPSRLTQPGAERRGPWPTEDPTGIVVPAAKRQG